MRSEDCIFTRDPEEKGGVLSLYPGFAVLPLEQEYLEKQYSNDKFRKRGILGVLFSNIPRFPNRGYIENQYSQDATFSEQGVY